MKIVFCIIIYFFITINALAQAAPIPLRILAEPKGDCSFKNHKVKDVLPFNCDLESNCNYLYSVLFEEFDYNFDLPNKWQFNVHGGSDDDVAGTGNYTTWFGDGYWDNTLWPPVISNHNVQVSGGVLTLKNIAETVIRNGRTYEATSGAITSFSNFRTGIFEARIKVPSVDKMWPAFWLLNNQSTYGEFDIFEFYDNDVSSGTGCDTYNLHKMTLHNGSTSSPFDNACERGDKYPLNINAWHTYKLDWDEYSMAIYVDGFLVGFATKYYKGHSFPMYGCIYGSSGNPIDPLFNFDCEHLSLEPDNLLPHFNFGSKPNWLPSWIPWPPPQPYLANRVDENAYFPDKHNAMSLIINNNMNFKYKGNDFTGYTQSSLNMEIDWVKVYQPFCCGIDKTVYSMVNLDYQTYNTDILTGRYLSIGLANNAYNFHQYAPTAPIYRDIPVILLATDEIAIHGEAVFEGNTYAEMRITDCGNSQRINSNEKKQLDNFFEIQQQLIDSTNLTLYDSIINSYYKSYIDSISAEYKYTESENIIITPIPSSDFLTINTNDWRFEQINYLYLIDVNGRRFELKKERKINIEMMLNGTYVLKIKMKDGTEFIKKIIKI